MMHRNIRFHRVGVFCLLGLTFILLACSKKEQSAVPSMDEGKLKAGLVGVLYDDDDFTRPISLSYLSAANSDKAKWPSRNDWSARWRGVIEAPYSGQVSLFAETDGKLIVEINGQKMIDIWKDNDIRFAKMKMKKGEKYPLVISYSHNGGMSYMRLYWSWPGQKKTLIPEKLLWFRDADEQAAQNEHHKVAAAKMVNEKFDVSSIIDIHSPRDVQNKRNAFIRFVFGPDGFPLKKLPNKIEKSITDSDFDTLTNLKRIDKLSIEMEWGLNSIAYHFIPVNSNNELVIYHQGHNGKFSLGVHTIQAFLEKGYSVIGMSMPIKGMNRRPVIQLPRFGKMVISSHNQFGYLQPKSGGHPVKYFLEPVAAVVNYAQKFHFKRIIMIGISGGGWTTTVYSAIDPRIRRSFPVAGSWPIYLRARDEHNTNSWGDYEQYVPQVYRIANYPELYIMGAFGKGRGQLQILNEFDACCFGGRGFVTYKDIIIKRVQELGKGSYDLFLDSSHHEHKISDVALKVVFEDLQKNN